MYINGITANTLCVGFLSFGIMSSRFVCALVSRAGSFCCWVVSHCVYIVQLLFLWSSVNGYLACFQLGIWNKIAVNITEQVFLWTYVFLYLGSYPWVELLGQRPNVWLTSDLPISSVSEFQLFHIFADIWYCLFIFSDLSGYELVSHWV